MQVIHCDNIIVKSDGKTAERTREIYQVTVYRQDGEYMSLYDDGLEEFLGYKE